MRNVIPLAICLCFVALPGNAATISVELLDLTGGFSGNHTIGIYVSSDQPLGISGAQIDVIAQDTNANYTGLTSLTGTNVLADGYSHINPVKVDATTANETVSAMLPQPVTGLNNGNLDAVGFSFSTTPGNVDPTGNEGLGAIGQSGSFELVGKESWSFTDLSTLKAWVTGAQYFNPGDNGSPTDTFSDFTTAVSIPFTFVVVPEPTSMGLLGLGGICLVRIARRRRQAR